MKFVSLLSVLILSLLLVQLPTTGQAPSQRRQLIKLVRAPQTLTMGKAFREGKLPEPARLPSGTVDQQAAALAKALSLRDDSSTAALYAAVLAAGYGVRDTDGSVMQTQQRGQGLVLNAWELAAAAKLYGEDYGVMLSHLSDAFVRSVPELKTVPLANAIVEGIRSGANSNNPSVRFLSRFIVELGKNSQRAYDLLDNVDPTKTRLDAIQVALILSRLSGDLTVLQQKTARLDRQRNFSHARSVLQSPCPTDDTQDLILDYNSLTSTFLFGILSDRLGGKLGSYSDKAGLASLVAAVFKFIASYALLNVEITMDAELLERTKSNKTPGDVRTLTAKLKIDRSPWERLNCLRPVFGAAGLDLEMPKSGPLSDVTVEWRIILGGDSRGILSSVVDVLTGEDAGDALIFFNAKPGANRSPDHQIADSDGVSTIEVIGAPQKQDLTRRKVFEVYKPAGVTVDVAIKPMKIKDTQAALSNLVDIMGNVISFLTDDPIGGGVGVVFETMYRANWYSAKPFYFMVKDWEPCNGQWQGTITYTTTLQESGSAESFVNKQSWNNEFYYKAEAHLDGRKDNLGAPIARVSATAHEKKERFSSGKGECYRTAVQLQELTGSGTAMTTGFSVTSNPRSGEYWVTAPTIVVDAQGRSSVDSEVKGTCRNPFNKDLHEARAVSGGQLSPEGPLVQGRGRVDPNNPDQISGTETVTIPTNKGGERKATITWSLTRCKDQ